MAEADLHLPDRLEPHLAALANAAAILEWPLPREQDEATCHVRAKRMDLGETGPPRYEDPVQQLKDSARRWSEARVERILLPQSAVWLPGAKRVSLAMFAACDALGVGIVSGSAPHLYAEDISDRAFEELGLVSVQPGQRVDVFVREPKYPEAVFRGAVWQDGVPSSDILRCWLDVGDHPVRGADQAQHIWNRVLKPRLLET